MRKGKKRKRGYGEEGRDEEDGLKRSCIIEVVVMKMEE
jgi:hypothetical protein